MPDASALIYQQTDESDVETRYIANALHPEEKPAAFGYPKAGSPNAVVRLGLIAREGGGSAARGADAIVDFLRRTQAGLSAEVPGAAA